jgi:glutaredoxin
MNTAIYYHAGCPVCVAAEENVVAALDASRFKVERVHLGKEQARIAEAELAGVKSVPALVLEGQTFHLNFGAAIEDVKA